MDDKAEKVALFRYGLIAPLVLETLPRGELTRRAQQIAARLYDFPHSTRRQVSVDTLLDWTLRYRRNGLAALSPKPRQDRGQARAVAPETAALIERLKRENPHRTGAALLRELATANEAHQAGLSASTLYRFLRARGLTERQLLLDKATAHKKYEAAVCQSDLAVRHALRPLGRTPGRRQAAGLPAGRARRCQPPHPARPVLSQPGTGRLSRLPAPGHRRPRHPHPPLHGQRQDLPLPAVGPHRRFHRHPHRAHPSLSARRPRQDRTFLPFRARTVSGLPRSQSSALPRATQRALVALARHRSITAANTARSRPRRCCAGSAISNRSANFRRPPIYGVCSFIAWTGWCAAIPPSC